MVVIAAVVVMVGICGRGGDRAGVSVYAGS